MEMKELVKKLLKDDNVEKYFTRLSADNLDIRIHSNEDGAIVSEINGHPLTIIATLNEIINNVRKQIDMTDEEYKVFLACTVSTSRKVDE